MHLTLLRKLLACHDCAVFCCKIFLKDSSSERKMTSIHFITKGGATNTADSEYMQGQLMEAAFTISLTLEETEVVVINSGAAKTPVRIDLI